MPTALSLFSALQEAPAFGEGLFDETPRLSSMGDAIASWLTPASFSFQSTWEPTASLPLAESFASGLFASAGLGWALPQALGSLSFAEASAVGTSELLGGAANLARLTPGFGFGFGLASAAAMSPLGQWVAAMPRLLTSALLPGATTSPFVQADRPGPWSTAAGAHSAPKLPLALSGDRQPTSLDDLRSRPSGHDSLSTWGNQTPGRPDQSTSFENFRIPGMSVGPKLFQNMYSTESSDTEYLKGDLIITKENGRSTIQSGNHIDGTTGRSIFGHTSDDSLTLYTAGLNPANNITDTLLTESIAKSIAQADTIINAIEINISSLKNTEANYKEYSPSSLISSLTNMGFTQHKVTKDISQNDGFLQNQLKIQAERSNLP